MNKPGVEPGGTLQLAILPTSDLSSDQRDEIVDLCTRAFAFNFSSLFTYVSQAQHVCAFRDGRLVGHALWGTRWLQPEGHPPLRTCYVDAVATDPTLWGQGIGSVVMRRLVDETRDFELLGLSTERPDFYARLGWERWQGPTRVRRDGELIPTPGDLVMIYRTWLTPLLDLHAPISAEWRDGQPW
jgi:aminoglycoside 2'-N-acetyltransferase I